MREDYAIRVTGRQDYGGDTGEVSVSTAGSYTRRDGIRYIAYKEREEDSAGGHTAVLKVEPGKVTLLRTGSATRLILEQGRRHQCLYDAGFGSMTVGVFASQLSADLNDAGGWLEVRYALDVDGDLLSRNQLRVEVASLREGAGHD